MFLDVQPAEYIIGVHIKRQKEKTGINFSTKNIDFSKVMHV